MELRCGASCVRVRSKVDFSPEVFPFKLPRRFKLHKSKMLGDQKPVKTRAILTRARLNYLFVPIALLGVLYVPNLQSYCLHSVH